MSAPDTFLNQSSSSYSSDKLKIIIKAANQKYEDFIIEEFELDWTVKNLKQYLADNYPFKPELLTIRLIYSGKMLHDHWILSECIRHNSEVKSHIIHLVHSSTEKRQDINSISINSARAVDLENELTPDSSTLSSPTSSTSSSDTSTPTSNSNLRDENITLNETFIRDESNLFYPVRENNLNINPKQLFDQVHTEYLRYYESMGISIEDNAWYSSYIQQLALYRIMYYQYMQSSLSMNYSTFDCLNNSQRVSATNRSSTMYFQENPITNQVQQTGRDEEPDTDPIPHAPQQVQPRAAAPVGAPVQQPIDNERDDDWLSLLHNIVSFLVLFSIIYYYSSMERFLVIFTIVVIMIIYHNGWLSIQRRQIQPHLVQLNHQENNINHEPADEENTDEQPREQNESNNFNSFRLFISFVLTFFTSLIPERPRIAN